MPKQLKRIFLWIAGILFLALGVAGLALPFLQGFLFLMMGIILLSLASPTMRGWIEAHTRRYPRIHAFFEKTEKWIVGKIGSPDED